MMTPSEAQNSHRKPLRLHSRPTSRATSHTGGAVSIIVLVLVALGGAGCGDSSSAGPPAQVPAKISDAARASIEGLRLTFAPISPIATSDKQYEWRTKKRDHLLELERGSPSLAPAALESFEADAASSDEWRTALLSVAAHTDPELTRPLLERLSLQYDAKSTLGVRTEASRLLCETSPAVAVGLFEPTLLEVRPSVTLPPKELMLRHWIAAARSVRRPIDETLARIAVDIAQTADVRYVAVDELGAERASRASRKALETVLVETSSDGLLRRKAAQAVHKSLPRADACTVLTGVLERESDPSFIYFLDDLVRKTCP